MVPNFYFAILQYFQIENQTIVGEASAKEFLLWENLAEIVRRWQRKYRRKKSSKTENGTMLKKLDVVSVAKFLFPVLHPYWARPCTSKQSPPQVFLHMGMQKYSGNRRKLMQNLMRVLILSVDFSWCWYSKWYWDIRFGHFLLANSVFALFKRTPPYIDLIYKIVYYIFR